MSKKEELEILNQENIDENIKAKKTANYGYDLPGGQWRRMAVSSKGALLLNGLVPEEYDEAVLGYTGADLTTVTYKLNDAVVATLTLTYDAGVLQRVVRS